jgi:hypothetical protein
MTVPGAVTLDALEQELPVARDYVAAAGLTLDDSDLSSEHLRFYVTFRNADGELFHAEFDCRNYPLHPPTIEFLDAVRQRRGLPSLYPAGFHGLPCVCMRYNKAYADLGGPHGDWRLVDWQLATPGGGPIDSIAMMVSDLHGKISISRGRMG